MGGKEKNILEECEAFLKKLIQLFDRQCNSMHGEIINQSYDVTDPMMTHGSETSKDSSGCIVGMNSILSCSRINIIHGVLVFINIASLHMHHKIFIVYFFDFSFSSSTYPEFS